MTRTALRRAGAIVALLVAARASHASATGLNTIPTTDLVPVRSWIGQTQNGNAGFLDRPTFYQEPDMILQSQFSLSPRAEAGVDFVPEPGTGHYEFVGNAKWLANAETDTLPNAAIGFLNVASHQTPNLYVTFSKTLNYEQQQAERFRAHHRRNRKLLGRRIHAGLFYSTRGTVEPFVGTDIQLNDNTVFQADWINGAGNAVSIGAAYVLPDQRTVLNPALLISNSSHRPDGFFLNISHQFNL